MKFFIFLVLNFFVLTKTTKIYKVVAARLSDKPILDNNDFIFGSSATLFNQNGTLGMIVESRLNSSYVFITSAIALLPDGSYAAEPLKKENILPLSFKLNMTTNYPSISYINGMYYLLYNEGNKRTYQRSIALATSSTPLKAETWTKLENFNISIASATEYATILWTNSISYMFFGYITDPSKIGKCFIRVKQFTAAQFKEKMKVDCAQPAAKKPLF